MKRLALLIGSPSSPNTPEAGSYLAGVKTDIENMYRFLTSSIGGSWQKDEIKHFYPNPSYAEIEPYLQDCENTDFAFVYFSGHGGTDKRNNKPRVKFNISEDPYIYELANRANHQITIIDACRTDTKYYNFSGDISENLSGIKFPNSNPVKSRNIYNEYISKLPNSRVLLYATAPGLPSFDNGSGNGGLFSTSLLETVKSQIEITNNPILDIASVFTKAQIKTNKRELEQIPVLYTTKPKENAIKLPFGVNTNFKIKYIQSYEEFNKKEDTAINEIVKIGLISAGVIGAGILIGSLFSNK